MGKTVNGKSKKKTAAGKGKKAGEGAAIAHENPLVPNELLRRMFQKMVELRLLEGYARRRTKAGARVRWHTGHEACRVSIALGLNAGDVVLDSRPGGLMGHLFDAKLAQVLGDVRAITQEAKSGNASKGVVQGPKRLLPFVNKVEERLFAGLGVALLQRQMGHNEGVVIFAEHSESANEAWRGALKLAATEELPVLFVVLPNPKGGDGKVGVSSVAHRCGVPGIHVDASDAIALYRVVQESWMRIRNNGGPVLMECIPFHLQGEKVRAVTDPVAQLKRYLLKRGVGTAAWMAQTEKSFRRQLLSKQAS